MLLKNWIPWKNHRQDSEFEVFDAVRVPLATDASIPSGPSLILTTPGGGGPNGDCIVESLLTTYEPWTSVSMARSMALAGA